MLYQLSYARNGENIPKNKEKRKAVATCVGLRAVILEALPIYSQQALFHCVGIRARHWIQPQDWDSLHYHGSSAACGHQPPLSLRQAGTLEEFHQEFLHGHET